MSARRIGYAVLAAGLSGFMAAAGTSSAWAYWTAGDSSHSAHASADKLPAGQTPSVTMSFPGGVATATTTFDRLPTQGGQTVSAFVISRYSSATGGTPVGTFTCTPGGSGSSVTCTEADVPAGTWYYTDTPTVAGSQWLGAESARSTGVATDNTPPTVTYSQSPTANGGGYNTSAVAVTLTATDNSGGTGVAYISYTVDGGSAQKVNASTTTFNVTGDGTHSVTYSATDNAGNTSTVQSQTVRIDSTPPDKPVITGYPAYINRANVSAVTIGGTAEAGSTVTLSLTDGVPADTITRTAVATSGGTWSFSSVNAVGLSDGQVTLSATSTDAAGNTSTSAPVNITKDTIAPAIAVTAVTNPISQGNQASTAASGTVSDANPTTVTVVASDSNGAQSAAVNATITAGWSASPIDVSALKNGQITYTATATDVAGNTSTGTKTATKSSAKQFLVSADATQTAGHAFTVTITAQDEFGTTDASYSGQHNVTLTTNAGASPDGTSPTLPASQSSLTFTSGVATVSITLVRAEAGRTITATSGTLSGTSNTINVNPGSPARLAWTNVSWAGGTTTPVPCLFTCDGALGNNATFSAKVAVTDGYGNAVANLGSALSVNVTTPASGAGAGGTFTAPTTGTAVSLAIPSTGTAISTTSFTFKTQTGGGSTFTNTISTANSPYTNATASLTKS